jgi:carboxymethylenebutenolidase
VPDFLSGKGPDGGGSASLGANVGQTIRTLQTMRWPRGSTPRWSTARSSHRRTARPASTGFCWGGTQSFNYAIAQPNLDAAVVYYGNPTGATADSAPEANLAKIKAPVLGLYGGNDARIDSTIPPTEAAMKKLGKFYEPHLFEGAGHGFMFSQAGAGGANLKAAEQAWPLTIAFFQKHLK